jgi:hypothetical protein
MSSAHCRSCIFLNLSICPDATCCFLACMQIVVLHTLPSCWSYCSSCVHLWCLCSYHRPESIPNLSSLAQVCSERALCSDMYCDNDPLLFVKLWAQHHCAIVQEPQCDRQCHVCRFYRHDPCPGHAAAGGVMHGMRLHSNAGPRLPVRHLAASGFASTLSNPFHLSLFLSICHQLFLLLVPHIHLGPAGQFASASFGSDVLPRRPTPAARLIPRPVSQPTVMARTTLCSTRQPTQPVCR